MLEKGRRGRYFPQSFFPWNSPLDITDLHDRVYLRHESFALCTLHSHLPIPDEVSWKPGMEHPRPRQPFETAKRPMFDLGIYERPNMLDFLGIEPGTIGLRTYLEIPVSDGHKDEGPDTREAHDATVLQQLSASEAFKVLAHDEGAAQIGKHAPKADRILLVREGPKAWKRIGVRNITIKMITDRLVRVSALRDEVVEKGWRYTILNFFSSKAMGEQLFSDFLYPPSKIMDGHSDQNDLKVQIEALAKVLTTPDAWLNFSLPVERSRFMQHISTREAVNLDKDGLTAQARRHYSLVQLLLAIELLLRLDAALRLGIAQHAKGYEISSAEIHHFNKLRNLKLDWDFVMARRFLDLCYAKDIKTEGQDHPKPESPGSPGESHGLLHRFKRSLSTADNEEREDAWRCAVLPRQPKVMAEGLVRFGRFIGWPEDKMDAIEDALVKKLQVPVEQQELMIATGVERVVHPHIPLTLADVSTLELRPAHENTLGGPMSHAWFTGLILPGFHACDLLMCTILENDPTALQKLGSAAHLRSGFILDSKSWWSKICVVGGVLAPMEGHHERMGWVGLPSGLSIKDDDGKTFGNGWRVISTKEKPVLRQGARIFDGDELAKQSSPLGIGTGHVLSNEFKMVTDSILDNVPRPSVKNIELVLSEIKDRPSPASSTDNDPEYHAFLRFNITTSTTTTTSSTSSPSTIDIDIPPSSTSSPPASSTTSSHSWALRYSPAFIPGHPCRPPHGHAILPSGIKAGEAHQHPKHKHAERLPAHPLHQSYKYVTKSLEDLLDLDATAAWLPDPTDSEAAIVWIVDARGGGWEGEVLARAWCARVGRDALVARVGTCCVGCAVRECRAVQVGVLIRVGSLDGS